MKIKIPFFAIFCLLKILYVILWSEKNINIKNLLVMKFKITLFIGLFFTVLSYGQYTTPDTGVTWTLDDIATASPTTITVSGTVYTLNEDLIISETDTLQIDSDLTLEIEDEVQITVFGTFTVDSDNVLITAVDSDAPYRGFRLEEFSEINIQNATIEYGGGFQVLTETFTLNNCVLQNNVSGVSTSAVVNLFRGIITITNNHFLNNLNPAVASGATNSVSGNIVGNIIEYNNSTNNNRPQINMGPTRTDAILRIADNTVLGDRDFIMAGGIAVSNLMGTGTILAEIENNIIKDNRYGITIAGPNATVLIKDNIIEDNDTQDDPMLGGSGINLLAPTGGQDITITGNEIRRNLWGITFQGPTNANLGDDEDNPGGNIFADNGNGGSVYAISMVNNGSVTYMAKHNCWIEGEDITSADAESVIHHQVDDSDLGLVIFDPVYCATSSTADFDVNAFTFYPNPAQNTIYFDNAFGFETVHIMDIQGKKVVEKTLSETSNEVSFNLPQGMYFVKFESQNNQIVKKLVVR